MDHFELHFDCGFGRTICFLCMLLSPHIFSISMEILSFLSSSVSILMPLILSANPEGIRLLFQRKESTNFGNTI